MRRPVFHTVFVVLAVVAVAVALASTGCSNRAVQDLKSRNEALQSRVTELEGKLRAAEEETITLYFAKSTPTELWLVPELRKVSRKPDMLRVALEELIRGPADQSLGGLIPKDTKVIDVAVRDFVAYPNFSAEITRVSVGSRGEALMVASIANTLIKFPGVEKVQIMVDGRKVESLAGHVDISGPVGRDEAVLAPPLGSPR